MKTATKIFAATFITAALAAAGTALAHGGMGMGPGMMGMGHGMMGPGMGHGMMGMGPGMMGMAPGTGPWMGAGPGPDSAASTTSRLAEMKTALTIKAEQEAAWNKYATLVTQQAEARDKLRTQMHTLMSDPQTAAKVDHAAQRETMLKFQQESLTTRQAALKELYAVLTPDQKAVADRRLQAARGHRMAGRLPAQ